VCVKVREVGQQSVLCCPDKGVCQRQCTHFLHCVWQGWTDPVCVGGKYMGGATCIGSGELHVWGWGLARVRARRAGWVWGGGGAHQTAMFNTEFVHMQDSDAQVGVSK